MQAWLFRGGELLALCADRTGAGLPAELGPWTYMREVALDHDGTDEEQARTLIEKHGYCCFEAGEPKIALADRS